MLNKEYIDKTKYIEILENTKKNSFICFRPRRFGKSVFISMLKEYYDCNNINDITFNELYIGKNQTKRKNSFLILDFDFSGFKTSNFIEFNNLFNSYINGQIYLFLIKYKDLLYDIEVNKENCIENLNLLVGQINIKKYRLYILIDEYDTSVNRCLVNKKNEKENIENIVNIENIENTFKSFFSNIKKYTQQGVYAFVTGVTPLALSEYTSGYNSAYDISLLPEFNETYGLNETEVRNCLEKFIDKNNYFSIIDELMIKLKEKHNGYRFTKYDETFSKNDKGEIIKIPIPIEAMYNPTRILYAINMIKTKFKNISEEYLNNNLELCKILLNFDDEPNSKPAEHILEFIVNNSLFQEISENLLLNGSIECKLQNRFTLSKLNDDINIHKVSLLSFLYFMGALTICDKNKDTLIIPNEIAKKEFIKEGLNLYKWEPTDLDIIKDGIIKLINENEIYTLCYAIDNMVLSKLSDNQVIHHNEAALVQIFFDAFLYTFASYDIFSEYKVNLNKKEAIDLALKTKDKTTNLYFEFKNISMNNINTDTNNWEKLTEFSNNYMKYDDDKILNLSIKDEKQKFYEKTVGDYFKKGIQDVKKKYLNQLKNQKENSKIIIFLILRVGLRRLIIQEIKE